MKGFGLASGLDWGWVWLIEERNQTNLIKMRYLSPRKNPQKKKRKNQILMD